MHLVIGLWVVWLVPVSRLSAWASALSTRLCIPCAFRQVAFASGTILCPLPSAWADTIGVATFRTDEVW